jgi:hypothetical protein
MDEIGGSNTRLRYPEGFALDVGRNVYVANFQSVTVYAAGTYDNAAPSRIISGSNTSLFNAGGLAVDGGSNIYVTQRPRHPAHRPSVTVYAAGANGNIAPIQKIEGLKTELNNPWGIAVDDAHNIYVANEGIAFGNGTVTVYRAGAGGDVAPIQTITGDNTGLIGPVGIALDADRNIYVANFNCCSQMAQGVNVYAAGAKGNVPPIRQISGSNTGIRGPLGIALDASLNLYVADSNSAGDAVLVFAAGANGNVAPIRTISGSKAQLSSLFGIAAR